MPYVVASALLVWLVVMSLHESAVNAALGRQASAIAVQNHELANQDRAYQRDIQALGSQGGMEQQARAQGYIQRGEQLYILVQPSPAVSRTSRTEHFRDASMQPGLGVLGQLRRWINDNWHW